MAGDGGNILVCGGAGYIGSHMCKMLSRAGYTPVTFDNFSTGHRWAVKWGPLVEGDLLDQDALADLFAAYRFDAVMHFAARSQVGESMREPGLYFRNNVTGTLNLLDAMVAANVGKLVFSSTAAVYGNPEYVPIDEAHPTQPINPYGWSKLMAERQIAEYCRAYGLRAICLRYFNAAGADPDGETGEAHEPETHLIPNVIRAALDPSKGPVTIFGNNYQTPDGTCVRDYIHVADLCDAHLRALEACSRQSHFQAINLGTGKGHSVSEVISVFNEMSQMTVGTHHLPPRPGDPAVLVASNETAARQLDWAPKFTIFDCLESAFRWHQVAP